MKIIAQTAALQEAMNVVGSIVATRTPKPILQCVKLIAADNTLTLLATDLEAGARHLGEHGARWVTAHASGGTDMMMAAVTGLGQGNPEGGIEYERNYRYGDA